MCTNVHGEVVCVLKSIRVDLAYDLFPVTVARSGLFGRFKDQFTQHLIPDIIGHLICLYLVS